MTVNEENLPLKGIRILDVGHILAGPMTSSMLADFGADVIHIESPETGDFDRELAAATGDAQVTRGFHIINRNKRNITLDMRKTQGRDLFHRLVAISDVVTENFRPYVMVRWGHSWPVLHSINPRLIYCRLSGYGLTGTRQHRRCYGRLGESFGGWCWINGFENGMLLPPGFSWGDSLDSIWAANAIMAALYWRDAQGGGEGMLIDQSLVDPMVRSIEQQIIIYDQNKVSINRMGTQHESTPYAGVSETKDGHYFSWAAPSKTCIRHLLQAVGLAKDARFNDFDTCLEHRKEFQNAVAKWMKARTLQDVWNTFEKFEAIGSPVTNAKELCEDPHVKARDMLVPVTDPEGGKDIIMQGIVPKLSETPGRIRNANELLGARNEEVYCGLLGLTKDELRELDKAGVTSSAKGALY